MSALVKRLIGMAAALGASLDTGVRAGGGPRVMRAYPPLHNLREEPRYRSRWRPRKRYVCTLCRRGGTADDFRTLRCVEASR